MHTYNLNKLDISQLLGLLNNNSSLLKFVGLFDKKSNKFVVYSTSKLSSFGLKTTHREELFRINKFKGRFKYTIKSSDYKPLEFSSLINSLNSFSFNSQLKLKITIRNGNFEKQKINYHQSNSRSKKTEIHSNYSIVSLFGKPQKEVKTKDLSRIQNNECFKVSIVAESLTEEAYQFLSSFRPQNSRVIKKGFFNSSNLLVTKVELETFLNLKNYEYKEIKEISKPILLGHTEGGEKIEFSEDRTNEHIKIEGVTRSGKSGAMISILTKKIDDGQRVLFVDPHNSTTQLIHERVKDTSKIKHLFIENLKTGKFLGKNILINLGSIREREEYIENLEYAFFNKDAMDGKLATLEVGRELLKAGVQFNYEYVGYLRKKQIKEDKILEILKEKQFTLNDLKRVVFDESLRNAMSEVLSKNYPMLARKLTDLKQFNSQGLNACINRFAEPLGGVGKIFFEGRGFNPIQHLKSGYSVFCDIKEVSEIARPIINSLIFSRVVKEHMSQTIQGKTYFCIDEAASASIPKLMQIVTETNKFDLHLVLAYQEKKMWRNEQDRLALDLIPNLIEFNIEKNPKDKREFELKMTGTPKLRGYTIDYPKELRKQSYENVGQTYEQILKKISQKENNSYEYFIGSL